MKLPDGARDWAVGDTLTVPAGQYRDAGNVRFSCPPDGDDCDVAFVFSYCIPGICVDMWPGAVSLGGAATADLVVVPSGTAFFKHANVTTPIGSAFHTPATSVRVQRLRPGRRKRPQRHPAYRGGIIRPAHWHRQPISRAERPASVPTISRLRSACSQESETNP